MLVYLQMIESPEDKSKFAIIYTEYSNMLYRIAFSILKNHEDAEDAVQDAFEHMADHMDKIDDPKSAKARAYVAVLVRSRAIDIYRKRKSESAHQQELIFGDAGFSLMDLESVFLSDALVKLPENYQTVLILRYQFGYSNRDVADIMHISAANAKKLAQRAKAKFEELLKEEA